MRGALTLATLLFAACGARTDLERPPPPDANLDAFAPPDADLDAGRDAPVEDGCLPEDERCDGVDTDCDGVPDDGLACWTVDGEPISALDTTLCGAAWYGYGSPAMASANPPLPDLRASQRATVVLLEMGAGCGGGAVAIIADEVADGSGGTLLARFSFERDDGAGILAGDEPNECELDRAALRGECVWTWQPCCTDGVMLGPFPASQCVELMIDGHDGGRARGIDRLVAQDGPRVTRELALGATHRVCRAVVPAI